MRVLFRGVVALVILVAAYWGWALAGAGQLASAASRGDAEAVIERVDLQALIRSLSSQIARAYLDQNPQLEKLSRQGPAGGVVINAAAAEMLLRAFLTPENVAAFLSHGVSIPRAGGRGRGDAMALAGARRGVQRTPAEDLDELAF